MRHLNNIFPNLKIGKTYVGKTKTLLIKKCTGTPSFYFIVVVVLVKTELILF